MKAYGLPLSLIPKPNFVAVQNVSHKLDISADIKGTVQKTGELYIVLNGMEVQMDRFPPKSTANGVANGMLFLKVKSVINNK